MPSPAPTPRVAGAPGRQQGLVRPGRSHPGGQQRIARPRAEDRAGQGRRAAQPGLGEDLVGVDRSRVRRHEADQRIAAQRLQQRRRMLAHALDDDLADVGIGRQVAGHGRDHAMLEAVEDQQRRQHRRQGQNMAEKGRRLPLQVEQPEPCRQADRMPHHPAVSITLRKRSASIAVDPGYRSRPAPAGSRSRAPDARRGSPAPG